MSDDLITVWPQPPGAFVPQEFQPRKAIQPGEQLRRSRYVLRRLRDGSLTEQAPAEPNPEPPPPEEV
jgi:hypothetical protein